MLGAIWRIRDCVALLIALWITGLLSGALQPLGFIAALLSLGASIAFFAAWGIFTSLWASNQSQAIGRTLIFAILTSFLQDSFFCRCRQGSRVR